MKGVGELLEVQEVTWQRRGGDTLPTARILKLKNICRFFGFAIFALLYVTKSPASLHFPVLAEGTYK